MEDQALSNREGRAARHRARNEALRRERKQVKRHRKLDAPRRKDWLLGDARDPESLDVDMPVVERVVPRRERVLLRPEADEEEDPLARNDCLRGTVVEVATGLCRVRVGAETLLCGLRGLLSVAESGLTNVVAVGDEVMVAADGAGGGVVDSVLPRRSALVRPDVFLGHLQQVIAANIDQLLVVASWREPALWLEMIDRYLIAAERNGLPAVVCVNKVDLAAGPAECRAALAPYERLGYCVIFTSARTGEGVEALRELLRGKVTALSGLSGVGKSSLLAAVEPGLQLRTHAVSEHWHQGQHTTTQVTLWPLARGGFVADTPGIREFGLGGLHRGELSRYYPEIHALAGGCRFVDCRHVDEPGCAVRQAAAAGLVPAARYDNYQKIYRNLPE